MELVKTTKPKTITPHACMRTVLTDSEYANFCAAWDALPRDSELFCFESAKDNDAEKTLLFAFDWTRTEEDYHYWKEIGLRLEDATANEDVKA